MYHDAHNSYLISQDRENLHKSLRRDALADGEATQASCFPMLPDGVHAGINGGPGLPTKMAAAYDGIIKAGGDLAQIGVTWADVEPTKGMYDFSGLLGELQWAQSQGQHSVVGVRN